MTKKIGPKKSAKSARATAAKSTGTVIAKIKAKKRKAKIVPFQWQDLSADGDVIGVDEVGRGCLAGPVFAAAVILPQDFKIKGVTDSKLLTEVRRGELAKLIYDHAQVGIGFASVGEIDRLNILQASFLAMRRAIENLGARVGHILVDGNQRISQLDEMAFRQTTIIKGDLRALPISAASICAKVARDEMMKRLGEKYPQYGFEKHKGYACEFHRQAIQAHGPCVHHRSTFAGVREHWTDLLDEERAMDPF
jgi:ribonuclease HII